jgi:hypothetical protein
VKARVAKFDLKFLKKIYFNILSFMAHPAFNIIADYSSEELEVLLYMLKLPELRSLCRTFRIPSATQPKMNLIQALLAYGKSQQTVVGNKRCDSISIIKSRYVVVYWLQSINKIHIYATKQRCKNMGTRTLIDSKFLI